MRFLEKGSENVQRKSGKRTFALIVMICVLLAVFLSACSEKKTQKGICTDGEYTYYKVKFPSGKTTEDYFAIESLVDRVAVNATVSGNDPFRTKVVYIYSLTDGGYVAYSSADPSLTYYFSEDFPQDRLQKTGSLIVLNSDNYMSIEEAKQYIPSLS